MNKGTKKFDALFSNLEIVTIVVYLLGGESKNIETEDIAIRANKIAPGRFSWRKYPDQINIENIRTFLSDAKKIKNGGYLLGSGKKGWILSENGLEFAKEKIQELKGVDLSRPPISKEERSWLQREKTRMLASAAMEKLISNGIDAITPQDAESFFRVDDYVTGKAREKRIVRLLNTFSNDPEIADAIKLIVKKVPAK